MGHDYSCELQLKSSDEVTRFRINSRRNTPKGVLVPTQRGRTQVLVVLIIKQLDCLVVLKELLFL